MIYLSGHMYSQYLKAVSFGHEFHGNMTLNTRARWRDKGKNNVKNDVNMGNRNPQRSLLNSRIIVYPVPRRVYFHRFVFSPSMSKVASNINC